ncbi:MAG: hypothetical protein U0939_16770 [Pirellulales bacterium]
MSPSWYTLGSSTVWYALAERVASPTSPLSSVEAAECLDESLQASGLRVVNDQPRVWRRFCAEAAVAATDGGRSANVAKSLDVATLAACWRRAVAAAGSTSRGAAPTEAAFDSLASLPQQLADVLPRYVDQLPLRVRPLLEQWDARGPGLLRRLERELNRMLPPVDVHWVHPLRGGGGWAEPGLHVVFMEAVLVNPFAPVPEPLRLAWLMAQCAVDAAPESLIPVVLSAGEFVEWTTCDPSHIALARRAWLGKDHDDHVS